VTSHDAPSSGPDDVGAGSVSDPAAPPFADDLADAPAARWWHPLPDGRIQCDVCPRTCRLHEGQRGYCFVRACDGDHLVLTTYGRSSGFAVDPIEKKPLAHFYPGTPVLSFGTAGCNLGCRFCQNWDISAARSNDRLAASASPAQIATAAREAGCASVAFTYNDPVIFAEYALDTAEAAHEAGLRTVAVTAGYVLPEPRAAFFGAMDAANIDLKGFTEDFYWHTTGAHLRDVLDTIAWVATTDTWLELTTLVIPGHNDDPAQLRAMCSWIATELGPDVPLHLSAFHPTHKMRDVPPTPASTLRTARQIALDTGLHFVYTGNVHDTTGEITRCSSCGHVLIERDWYQLLRYDLTPDARCPSCTTPLPGRFTTEPGTWGRRTTRVTIR